MNGLLFSGLCKLVSVPGMWSVKVAYPTGGGGLITG